MRARIVIAVACGILIAISAVWCTARGAAVIDQEYPLVAFTKSETERGDSRGRGALCGDYVYRLPVAADSTITSGQAILFIKYQAPNGTTVSQISALVGPGTFTIIVDESREVPTIANKLGGSPRGFEWVLRMREAEAVKVRPCIN